MAKESSKKKANPLEQQTIIIRKDYLKFSSAHMTVFSDGSKEPLHGHNFQVELHVRLPILPLKDMLSFSVLKVALRELCQAWDEKILIASQCPYMNVFEVRGNSVFVDLCNKSYMFPKEEVAAIDSDNISTENLARVMCEKLLAALPENQKSKMLGVELRIEESLGQGASHSYTF